MSEAKYYEFLNSLLPHTVNKHGWVVANCMPFYESGTAVQYVLDHYPEAKPSDHLIILNPVRCRELAALRLPEFDYLIEHLEALRVTVASKLGSLGKQLEEMRVTSLMDQVDRELLESRIREMVGVHTGLIDAMQATQARKWELWNCGRLKEERI